LSWNSEPSRMYHRTIGTLRWPVCRINYAF
jgi:hypothetical protein